MASSGAAAPGSTEAKDLGSQRDIAVARGREQDEVERKEAKRGCA